MTKLSASASSDLPVIDGASIAVFKRRLVLLVKRGRPPFAGLWSLPGGKLEPGEEPRTAACRELLEETGLEATIDGVLDKVEIAPPDGDRAQARYRLTVFYGRALEGEPRAGGDAEAAQWVSLDALEDLAMTEGTRALIWLGSHRIR
jgi:ADP-ribose pyrophosphatase YjhB (NUDIX family)